MVSEIGDSLLGQELSECHLHRRTLFPRPLRRRSPGGASAISDRAVFTFIRSDPKRLHRQSAASTAPPTRSAASVASRHSLPILTMVPDMACR